MRTYTELQQEFDTRAQRLKTTREARAAGQAIYIAANFLKDNGIEPGAQTQEQITEALKSYPTEEQTAFADALQVYFDTFDRLTERLTGGQ